MIYLEGRLLEKFETKDKNNHIIVMYVKGSGLIKGVCKNGKELVEGSFYKARGNMRVSQGEPFFYFEEVLKK